jgi:hypothetical protein
MTVPRRVRNSDITSRRAASPHTVDAILVSSDVQAKEKADALGVGYMEKPILLKEVAKIIEDKLGK